MVTLSDNKESQAYRHELILRFFCQATYSGSESELGQEYGEYLTSWMRKAAENQVTNNPELPVSLFEQTFKLLNEALGEDAFRRFNGTRHLGPFSIACYEFVTSGVSANVNSWLGEAASLAEKVRSVWSASDFRDNAGTGFSPRRRVPRLVIKSRRFFKVQ